MSASHYVQNVHPSNHTTLLALVVLLMTYGTLPIGFLLLLVIPPAGVTVLMLCIVPPFVCLMACAPRAGTLVVVVLPVFFCFGVVLPPAIQQSREETRRTRCAHNLKAIALQNHGPFAHPALATTEYYSRPAWYPKIPVDGYGRSTTNEDAFEFMLRDQRLFGPETIGPIDP